jgi:archaellum biogenesis ATPase FlaH
LDENPYVAYVAAVLKKFTRLLTLDILSKDDLILTVEKYKQEYSAYEVNLAYSQSKIILYDGIQVGNKFYQGYNDSVAYVKKKIADIEAVLNKATGAGFIDSRTAGIEDDDDAKPEKIGDFDLIEELNQQLGGIYSSLFYNIIAPTKGGKSKFCSRLIHTIVVKYGYNATVWAHEGGYKAFWAQMRAIHFEYKYIRDKADNEKIAPLSQKDILYGNYPNETIKALEQESRLDLFTNPNYGVINMIDRPFLGETFIEEVDTSVQLNNSRVVMIDYLQLITSNKGGSSKSEVIGRAYQDALAYAKKRNVAIISPSQFKQDFMNEMAKSKDGQQHEVRTAGGESSEIIRTPDVNIALYASVEDLIRKEMTIMSVPSRLSEPFPDAHIYADLCSCVFSSLDVDE